MKIAQSTLPGRNISKPNGGTRDVSTPLAIANGKAIWKKLFHWIFCDTAAAPGNGRGGGDVPQVSGAPASTGVDVSCALETFICGARHQGQNVTCSSKSAPHRCQFRSTLAS